MNSHNQGENEHSGSPETPVSFGSLDEPLRAADDILPTGSRHRTVEVMHAIGNVLIGVKDVAGGVKTDFVESNHRIRDTASTVALAGTQAVGWTRLPMILAPKLMIDVLQSTHSAVEVGIVTGTAIGAWVATAGEALNQGFSSFPNATKKIEDNFPAVVSLFSDSLTSKEEHVLRQRSMAHKLGNTAVTHLRRGVRTVGIGIAPYVGAAHMKGVPKSTIRKLTAVAGFDSGIAIGLASGMLAETIIAIGHSHPELANSMQRDFGNTKLWGAAAVGLIVAEGVAKIRKSRRMSAIDAARADGVSLDAAQDPSQNIPGLDIDELPGAHHAAAAICAQNKLEHDLNNS